MKDIFDELLHMGGLYERVFGDLLKDLVYHQGVESRKNILKNVYGFRDIDKVFKKEIERDNFHELTKVIFRYQENQNMNNNTNIIPQVKGAE